MKKLSKPTSNWDEYDQEETRIQFQKHLPTTSITPISQLS
jgi:hypothetical protein